MQSSSEKGSPPVVTWSVVLVSLLIPYLTSLIPSRTPVIKITDGLIQGRVAYSRNGTEYWEFLGIPYAQPPLAKLRFQPPVPAEPWDGVKHVTSYPPDCAQFESIASERLLGNEDCLYVNVAVHPFHNLKHDNESLRPVLVNIPGGGFQFGGTTFYGPSYFMDNQDIIIVTMNYRLGPLGFLNFAQTQDEYKDVELPRGNMGLKDQLLALQWVQKNIKFFGGDPNRITIYGQSAGSVGAQLHMLSPKSKGLFNRVFGQSASLLSSWGVTRQPRKLAENLVRELGCDLENKKELLNCLQSVDPYELISKQKCILDPTVEQDIFVASVETVLTEDTFLSQHPHELFFNQENSFHSYDLVLAANSGDGALRVGRFDAEPRFIEMVESNWTNLAGLLCGFNDFPKNLSEKLRSFYFPENKSFTEDPQLFKDRLANMCGDSGAYEGIHTIAETRVQRNGSAPLYLFWYDYRPTGLPGMYSYYKAVKPSDWIHPVVKIVYTCVVDYVSEHILKIGKGAHQYGAAHSEDIYLLWVIDPLTSWLLSKRDVEFSQAFVKTIVDFVNEREPVSFRGVPWPNAIKGSRKDNRLEYMMADKEGRGKIILEPFTDGVRFWKSLGIRNFS